MVRIVIGALLILLYNSISIPLIWALAAHTNILPNDPMLWWALMMMPVGPTAMKVLALADVSGTSQKIRMSIAKFLTVSNSRPGAVQKLADLLVLIFIAFLYHHAYSVIRGYRSFRSCESGKGMILAYTGLR